MQKSKNKMLEIAEFPHTLGLRQDVSIPFLWLDSHHEKYVMDREDKKFANFTMQIQKRGAQSKTRLQLWFVSPLE